AHHAHCARDARAPDRGRPGAVRRRPGRSHRPAALVPFLAARLPRSRRTGERHAPLRTEGDAMSAGLPRSGRGDDGTQDARQGDAPESESDVMRRLEAVHRMRVLLSLMLLPPLLFFIFLVVWAHEGIILLPIGIGLYLYMLVQFFVVQNP